MRFLHVLIMSAMVCVAPAAQAGLIGDTLNAVYCYGDENTPFPGASFTPLSFVVGAGVETTGSIEGTTMSVDFTDASLTITLLQGASTWDPVSFNGPVFTLLSPGALGITGATVDPTTTLTGFDASRVVISDTQIGINWNGLSYAPGQTVVVDFTFGSAVVPEPSSIVALSVGCALPLLECLRRRRRFAA